MIEAKSDLRRHLRFFLLNGAKKSQTFPDCYHIIFCRNTLIYFNKIMQQNFIDNILILKNSGQNTSHSSVDIFKRFYRDQENKKSLGIGLSIVKRICDLYNFKINYSFEDCHIFKIEI